LGRAKRLAHAACARRGGAVHPIEGAGPGRPVSYMGHSVLFLNNTVNIISNHDRDVQISI
jgi:hypothetical protein